MPLTRRPDQDIRRQMAANHVLFGLVSDRYHCKPSRMGHDSGGSRLWWRQLTGSDATLDNAHVAEDYLARTTTMYRIIAVGRTCSVP